MVATSASAQTSPASTSRAAIRALVTATIAAVVLLVLSGCGSSKPSYCSDRSNLENSVKGLTNLNLSSGTNGLDSQLKKIQSDASSLVSSAKSDFPSQTTAIKSSVDTLTSTVKATPSSPSAQQIAAITANATSVLNSVKSFTDASNSKCS